MRLFLFAGTLLIFLAFYKGDGGYHDLVNYLDDAEGLWLHGDMRRVEGIDEEERPDGSIVEHPIYGYSQYSLGLAFVSGPFVLLGKMADLVTGEKTVDDNGQTNLSPRARKIAVLIVPLFAALTCLLIFEIGLLLGLSARASLWSAMMLAVASPLLSFARLYYTEVAVIFFTVMSFWAILRCHAATKDLPPLPPLFKGGMMWAAFWALVAGFGAAGAAGCHYAEAVMIAPLGMAMAVSVLLRRDATIGSRFMQLAALAAFPILAGVAILGVNKYRHGSFTDTGYGSDVSELALKNIVGNARFLISEHFREVSDKTHNQRQWIFEKPGLFLRNLWVLPAMICLIPYRGLLEALRGKSDKTGQPATSRTGQGGIGSLPAGIRLSMSWLGTPEILRAALLKGIVLQVLFWMCYSMLAFSPVRYFEPATGVLAIGLLFVGAKIESWLPRWGLIAAGFILIAWNLMFFFMNDDHNAPFAHDGPQSSLLIYTWYMEPFRNGLTDGYGTPIGATQWCWLAVLLGSGFVCWVMAWRRRDS